MTDILDELDYATFKDGDGDEHNDPLAQRAAQEIRELRAVIATLTSRDINWHRPTNDNRPRLGTPIVAIWGPRRKGWCEYSIANVTDDGIEIQHDNNRWPWDHVRWFAVLHAPTESP